VDHLTGMGALVQSDRRGRLKRLQLVHRFRTRLIGAGETPVSLAICLPVHL
jgi:hypothetical protein